MCLRAHGSPVFLLTPAKLSEKQSSPFPETPVPSGLYFCGDLPGYSLTGLPDANRQREARKQYRCCNATWKPPLSHRAVPVLLWFLLHWPWKGQQKQTVKTGSSILCDLNLAVSYEKGESSPIIAQETTISTLNESWTEPTPSQVQLNRNTRGK